MTGVRKNPALEAAKAQRQRDRRAIALLRTCRADGYAMVIDAELSTRLIVLASRILTARCAQTGEDPAAVLDAMESAI